MSILFLYNILPCIRNRVSTVNFPDKISAGKTPSSLAIIICSQSLVEPGITNPNLNLELSNNYPSK